MFFMTFVLHFAKNSHLIQKMEMWEIQANKQARAHAQAYTHEYTHSMVIT